MIDSSIRARLSTTTPFRFSAYCIAAAFCTYFCMYAFRKPFTAATFEGIELMGIGFKTVLVVSQVFGYMLSKFIGIKVISEMPANRRAVGILLLIGIAEISLLFFAIVPPPYNFVFLFINGLPLGMVFGLVLSYLEGRRLTEALAAGLCASFIVSSGVVKSVGHYLIAQWGVSEYWMPFLTGLIFVGPLIASVWFLNQIPPPKPEDIAHRSERLPMTAGQRRDFFRSYALGLSLLIVTYVLITVMRSIRDDFAVEIWDDLGKGGRSSIFAQSEMVVMLGVVVVNGCAMLIRDNRRAFEVSIATIIGGFLLVSLAVAGLVAQWLDGFSFMVIAGFGMYVPYVAFHTTIFERLIALVPNKGNLGYLMYLADAAGYLGYVAVMLCHNYIGSVSGFLTFFLQASIAMALLSTLLMLASLVYFRRRWNHQAQVALNGAA